jgi:hypothetical protein
MVNDGKPDHCDRSHSVLDLALLLLRSHYGVDATLYEPSKPPVRPRAVETRFARSLRGFSKDTILITASGLEDVYDPSHSNTASEAKRSSPVPPIMTLSSLSTQAWARNCPCSLLVTPM